MRKICARKKEEERKKEWGGIAREREREGKREKRHNEMHVHQKIHAPIDRGIISLSGLPRLSMWSTMARIGLAVRIDTIEAGTTHCEGEWE